MNAKSVAEWRKLLKLSYGLFVPYGSFVPDGQEGITIKGVKADIKNLEIPEMIGNYKVMAIGAHAFHRCKSLEFISFPSTVQKIECSAFSGCSNLSQIVIRNKDIGIADNAFQGCKNLADSNGFLIINGVLQGYFGNEEHVQIPASVTEISSIAFAWNKTVKSIIIPESVLTIATYAFSSCDKLEYVFVPKSVIRIGENAFKTKTNFKIETPSGSCAEKYAKNNKILLV